MGRDPLILYYFWFLCQIVAPFKGFQDIHHILLYAKGRDDILTWDKHIVHLEKKYVMGNDETSMSPELTQDHSGDV